ncbi:hypothetical protein DACRYDRAFT_25417 [Dacryopinax primogenitus]|uniref:Uncharacterized protein n=1 Tax=Dacryopinax primogenitus (strain DJM 731) TaxID=1858805 RepID=M5FQI4_DACPD|nr:uncharacterized protein DACRYDRAFT_25417 [Dacryopinax primogenitus]EJT96999.1 hypothetical protein DACRYDRAFT_25417 [Dacryopinax primogenitus]
MFPALAQSSRVAARQAPVTIKRGFAAAAKHGHNAMPAPPAEVYPLLAVVAVGSGFGIYSGVKAWVKEEDSFTHHRSTGNEHMKY